MLEDETAMIISNKLKAYRQNILFQTNIKGISKKSENIETLTGKGSQRPKSNFNNSKMVPSTLQTEVTLEQAIELLRVNPQVFMNNIQE